MQGMQRGVWKPPAVAALTRPSLKTPNRRSISRPQEWSPGSGVFILGAYAALELGPGALNLAGAKTGTAVVVDAVWRRGGGEGWLQSLRELQERYLL
jgi:hypothetical protein